MDEPTANPHFSPPLVARPARCREMWFFDPRGAERVLAVRRAPRGEKIPQIAAYRGPQ